MIVRLIAVVLVCALVVSGVTAESATNFCAVPTGFTLEKYLQTDTESACVTLDAITAARDACAGMTAGQVCLGAGDVQAAPQDSLVIVGTALGLDSIDSLTSIAGSLALLTMQADLPDDAAPLQLALFGDARIANAITGLQEPFPTVTVKNGPANILNLRVTPTTDGEVVTTMRWNEELTADGRNSAGDWLRVQTDRGAAWVFASLVTVTEGDANALYVLDSPVTQHMQSLTLTTSTGSCGGLLVQAANDAESHLQVNGALLTLSNTTLLLRAPEGEPLDIQVIGGSVRVSANGTTVSAQGGGDVQVGDAAPELLESFPFSSAASAPLDLLQTPACVAGVASGTAALFSAPGGASAGELDANTSTVITGQVTVDGVPWWQVGSTWVAQSDVATAGVCTAVPEVSPVAPQVSQPQASFANTILPAGRSIWNAHTGADNLTGVCTLPPIAQCDHLAAITPNGDGTLTWLGQEPVPYTLYPVGDNTYTGSLYANGAHLTVTVTITSGTTWTGSKTTVYDSDPGCTHTFSYTAELR